MKVNPFAAVLLAAVALPAVALERTAVPLDREPPDPWDAGATCSVTYANVCTGWLWTWDRWMDGDNFGVVLEPCCEEARLVATRMFFWEGTFSGYGYTGTVSITSVANGCPGTPYESRPFTPLYGGAFTHQWSGIPPGPVVLVYTSGPAGDYYDMGIPSIPTDHPAAGPTGPQSSGICFPSTRPIHTFYFGTADSPLCPGSTLNDWVGDAEAYLWAGQFSCPVSAEPMSWGSLKDLYR